MQTVTTKAFAKVAAVATGLAMATSMLSLAPMAHASGLTDAQVQSILGMLSGFGVNAATIANVQAALTGQPTTGGSTTTTTSSGCSITKDLTVGSTGAEVTCLQNALKAGGYMSANATGSFGPLTKAGVIAWQKAKGITPAAGYFGAKSRAVLGGSSSTTTTTTTTPATGAYNGTGNGLKIMLSPTSPSGTVLVQKQGIGDLGDYVFANPTASPITVTAVSFKRTGVSNDATLNNVYLYNGVNRITDSAGVNNSAFSFTNADGLFTIPAGQTYVLSIRADIADSTSGQQIGISLVSATASDALDSSVSFPINSGYQTVSAATLATVAFNSTTLPNGSNLTLSPQNDYPVWQNTLSVSGNPVNLSSMKFTNLGSISASNIVNLRLYVDGNQIGSAIPQLGSDRTVTFDLSAAPLSLSTQSHVVKVLGNIVGGASLTFALSIQRSSDAMFVDSQLNQPITPTSNGSSSNFSAVTASTVTINSVGATSGVSVTKDPASPTSDVSVGATGVKLATFDMLPSGENVKVMDLYVCATTAGTHSGTGLNNGKVYLKGVQIGSTKDITECSSANTDFSMGSSLILPAGLTSKVDIYADAQNAAGTNISTGGTALVYLKYVASNAQGVDSLTSTAVPASDTAANTVSITSSALTASKASGYANQTLLAGTNGALLGSFTLSAGSTEGLAVNTISLALSGYAGVTNLKLVDDATKSSTNLGSTISSPAATSNSFSVNFTLPASGTKTIDIYGDILSSATASVYATLEAATGSTGINSGTSAVLSGSSLAQLQTITVGAGQLYAVRSSNNPLSSNVIAGASSVKAAVFSFSAVNSPWTVNKLSVKIPNGASTAVNNVTLSYKDVNGTTQSVTQSLALPTTVQPYATATFTGLSFYVPAGSSSDLTVSVSTPTIASGSASISGAAISALIDIATGFQATDASGSASTTPGFITAVNVTGNSGNYGLSVLRKSIPTFAGQSLQSSSAPTSGSDLFRFTVTADAAGPVDLYKVSFNVATTVEKALNFSLYDAADTSTALNGTVANGTGATCTSGCNITVTLDSPAAGYVSIPAGTTKTFVLRASSLSGWATTASISTRFASVDTTQVPNALANAVTSTPLYVWSDESANNHSASSADWTNGYLVKNLGDGVYSYSANF